MVGYRGRRHEADHRRLGCGLILQETSNSRSLISGACRKARAIRRLVTALMSSGQSNLMVASRVSICSISSKGVLAPPARSLGESRSCGRTWISLIRNRETLIIRAIPSCFLDNGDDSLARSGLVRIRVAPLADTSYTSSCNAFRVSPSSLRRAEFGKRVYGCVASL